MNFLLSRVAKLVAHAKVLKSTILIKTGDAFVIIRVETTKKKSVIKVLNRLAVLSALSGKGCLFFF